MTPVLAALDHTELLIVSWTGEISQLGRLGGIPNSAGDFLAIDVDDDVVVGIAGGLVAVRVGSREEAPSLCSVVLVGVEVAAVHGFGLVADDIGIAPDDLVVVEGEVGAVASELCVEPAPVVVSSHITEFWGRVSRLVQGKTAALAFPVVHVDSLGHVNLVEVVGVLESIQG